MSAAVLTLGLAPVLGVLLAGIGCLIGTQVLPMEVVMGTVEGTGAGQRSSAARGPVNWKRLLVVSGVGFLAGAACMAAVFGVLALVVRFGFRFEVDWGPIIWPGGGMLCVAAGVVVASQGLRAGLKRDKGPGRRAR